MSVRTIELTVLCEGPTEAGFANRVLAPHLANHRVFVKRTIPLNKQNFGTITFARMRAAIKQEIGQAKAHQVFTTMIDLYALHDFPGQAAAATSPLEKVRNIEQAMRDELPAGNWHPYVQLHEFEALLFSDLDAILASFPDDDLTDGLRNLKADVTGLLPEAIDEGKETAPSKRIGRHLPPYLAGKATAGPAIAARIGIQRLRASCPHFDEWLRRLEALA